MRKDLLENPLLLSPLVLSLGDLIPRRYGYCIDGITKQRRRTNTNRAEHQSQRAPNDEPPSVILSLFNMKIYNLHWQVGLISQTSIEDERVSDQRGQWNLATGQENGTCFFRGPFQQSFFLHFWQQALFYCIISEYVHKVEVMVEHHHALEIAHHSVFKSSVQELIEGNMLCAFHILIFSLVSYCHSNHNTQTAPSFQNDRRILCRTTQKQKSSWCSCLQMLSAALHPIHFTKSGPRRREGRDQSHGLVYFSGSALLQTWRSYWFSRRDLRQVCSWSKWAEAGVLRELRRLHVTANFRPFSPKDLHTVLHLERHIGARGGLECIRWIGVHVWRWPGLSSFDCWAK